MCFIELLVIYTLCKRVGVILREGGQSPTVYQFLMVVFWFSGEIAGGILTVVILVLAGVTDESTLTGLSYLGGILAAICSASICFRIARSAARPFALETQLPEPSFAPPSESPATGDEQNPYISPDS